jgi:hypothetical protein
MGAVAAPQPWVGVEPPVVAPDVLVLSDVLVLTVELERAVPSLPATVELVEPPPPAVALVEAPAVVLPVPLTEFALEAAVLPAVEPLLPELGVPPNAPEEPLAMPFVAVTPPLIVVDPVLPAVVDAVIPGGEGVDSDPHAQASSAVPSVSVVADARLTLGASVTCLLMAMTPRLLPTIAKQ